MVYHVTFFEEIGDDDDDDDDDDDGDDRYKNGKELKSNKRYKMSFEGDEPSLTVVGAEANDQGSYMCRLSNKLGSVDTECTLTIQGERKILPAAHLSFCLTISTKASYT